MRRPAFYDSLRWARHTSHIHNVFKARISRCTEVRTLVKGPPKRMQKALFPAFSVPEVEGFSGSSPLWDICFCGANATLRFCLGPVRTVDHTLRRPLSEPSSSSSSISSLPKTRKGRRKSHRSLNSVLLGLCQYERAGIIICFFL